MSLFSGGKLSEKDQFSKKSHFYVEFLGWMECRGLRGQKYTDPIMRELKRRQKRTEAPPKLTIEVSRKDVKITQDVPEKHKKGIKKIKFPSIRARDVTYVRQATRPGDRSLDDIVACIYLGYMPRTQRYAHVHVYRFAEPKTAALFANQMATLVEENFERIREVEIDLVNNGEIDDPRLMSSDGLSEARTIDSALGSTSSVGSDDESPTFGSDEIDPDLQSLQDFQPFENVTDELKFRLNLGDSPLLLPPKDYDTIRRAHGNLDQINRRRCLNLNIVGENAVIGEKNGSSESGVDVNDNAGVSVKNMVQKIQSPQHEPTKSQNFVSSSLHPKSKPLKSAANSTQITHKSTSDNISKPIARLSNKPGFHDSDSPKSAHHSGNRSPESSSSSTEHVYPPKSLDIYQKPQRVILNRQNSESSKLTDILDEGDLDMPIRHYRSSSSNDIYTAPFRSALKPSDPVLPGDELPPDYLEDINEQPKLRGMNQRYGQAYLTRALSEDPNRNDIYHGISYRPISGELLARRRNLPSHATGAPHYFNGGILMAPLDRIGSSKRK